VTVLLGLTIAVLTVGLPGISDSARLQGAATQIAALYRLAAFEADRSGTPRLLELAASSCRIAQPQYHGGRWHWSDGATFSLEERVEVAGVSESPMGSRMTALSLDQAPPWRIMIAPGFRETEITIDLKLHGGARCRVQIDPASQFEEVEFFTSTERQ
jgi:hypothetical protein